MYFILRVPKFKACDFRCNSYIDSLSNHWSTYAIAHTRFRDTEYEVPAGIYYDIFIGINTCYAKLRHNKQVRHLYADICMGGFFIHLHGYIFGKCKGPCMFFVTLTLFSRSSWDQNRLNLSKIMFVLRFIREGCHKMFMNVSLVLNKTFMNFL